jgi:RNA polymerase sigma factor (TIGR02999 family)
MGVVDPSGKDGLAITSEGAAGGALAATPEIFAQLYAELHRVAERLLRVHGSDLTLGATTLLHEACLDLSRRDLRFADRPRFFAYAGKAMRTLIINYVRQRRALKRGGEFVLTSLDPEKEFDEVVPPDFAQLARLSDALDALARDDAPLAELIDLKFFCGLSFGEIASLRAISERSVQRDWRKARLFLFDLLREA